MPQIANGLVVIVASLQLSLLVVEMFFWKVPFFHQRLGFTLDSAITAAPIVANAGLYNGFLAAGLIWGLVSGKTGHPFKVFFLTCVMIAGIFGAATLKWTTLLQTVLGAIALLLVLIVNKNQGDQEQQAVTK